MEQVHHLGQIVRQVWCSGVNVKVIELRGKVREGLERELLLGIGRILPNIAHLAFRVAPIRGYYGKVHLWSSSSCTPLNCSPVIGRRPSARRYASRERSPFPLGSFRQLPSVRGARRHP